MEPLEQTETLIHLETKIGHVFRVNFLEIFHQLEGPTPVDYTLRTLFMNENEAAQARVADRERDRLFEAELEELED